jgi:hypothetical protein
MFYWVVADKEGKKRALMGPYMVYERALQVKEELDNGNAEIHETTTANRLGASRQIRHRMVEKRGLDEGFKNFRHR